MMSAEVSTSRSAGGQKVLDEDEWTECLEAIIQRDYFPNLPKLQNKLEWIQVLRPRSGLLHCPTDISGVFAGLMYSWTKCA